MELDWVKCAGYISKYLVRIEIPDSYGTGFFIEKRTLDGKEYTAFATAYHVIKHAHNWLEPIKIINTISNKQTLLLPFQYRVSKDEVHDVAIIDVPSDTMQVDLEMPNFTPPKSYVFVGSQIGWCGFPNIAPDKLCFFSGHISSLFNDEGDYLVDGTAIHGVSGGPVFVPIGDAVLIMGLVSAYIPNVAMGAPTPGLSLMRNINPIVDSLTQLKLSLPATQSEDKDTKA